MLKVNEYFDGKVKSLAFHNSDGKQTSGVMLPGEYQFDTAEHERVRVISGVMHVRLPGTKDFHAYRGGDEFEIEAHQTFQVKIDEASAYLCYYT